MNWLFSPAARSGLGAPDWIVATIIVAFLFVGAFELRSSSGSREGLALTRKQRWAAAIMAAISVTLLAFAIWRHLA
jgi:hypothetical protein